MPLTDEERRRIYEEELEREKARKKIKGKISMGWSIFWIVLAAIVGISFFSNVPTRKSETSETLYIKSRVLIGQRLKAPATADFASQDASDIEQISTDSWRVRSYVDAQNAFGANIRTTFDIVWKKNGEVWTPTKIRTDP